jgi:hypothetical protein
MVFSARTMTTLSAQTDDIALDPFDHDGFVVSVKRNLFEAEAVALHPDGEFICRAVRRHRSLAKVGYWLAASALIALGLIGMVAGLSQTSSTLQALVTVFTVVYLIVAITLAVRFAPHSPVVVLLDDTERADALPALVLKRGSRFSIMGDVSTMMAESQGEIGRLRRYGTNNSNYSLLLEDAPGVSARFVPERKVGTGAMIASILGPFGFLGALFVIGQPSDSWTVTRPGEGIRVGSLVKQKSALGDYVLDLTDDLDREVDRRALTLAALTVVLNRENAK